MRVALRPALAACLFVVVSAAGCATAPQSGLHATPPGLGQFPYSDADVDFMAGMIPHHAQAVVMAGWAPSHGARKDVAILCERIVVAQRDEIAMMQQWLRDRGLPVPDATSTRHRMKMNGVEHDMLMPGMLTDEEMAALDLVDVLFKSYGAAQDETVFKFANDVYADQSIEIDRMTEMLEVGSRPK